MRAIRSVKPFRHIRKAIRRPFSRLKIHIKKKLGWLGTPLLQTYMGYGTPQSVLIKGRVLEDYGISVPSRRDSVWQNMRAMLKRYVSMGLPDIEVEVLFAGQKFTTTTDDEGYFEVVVELTHPLHLTTQNQWFEARVSLPNAPGKQGENLRQVVDILVVGSNNQFGVVSDIDDTFLISHSTDLLRKLSLMALQNAHTRLPFDGVSAFYQALNRPQASCCDHPIFYVSSSEWPIYDLLADFCRFNQIPKGPFLLRDLENSPLTFWNQPKVNHFHKYDKIAGLMELYPDMRFILIGDSGQKDAEIYSRIVGNFPNRVLAIYIRDIGLKDRNKKVKEIAKQLQHIHRVPMLLVKDTVQAARHAMVCHYINSKEFGKVVVDKMDNQELPTEMEQLMGTSPSARTGIIRRK